MEEEIRHPKICSVCGDEHGAIHRCRRCKRKYAHRICVLDCAWNESKPQGQEFQCYDCIRLKGNRRAAKQSCFISST